LPESFHFCAIILKEKKMKITNEFIEVPEDLKPYVKGIWYVAGEGRPGEISPMQCCLPNGLTELIISLNPKQHQGSLCGTWMVFPNAYLVGVMSEPVYWNMESGAALFGISLKPETLMTLFNLPAGEIADTFAETDVFFGNLLGDLIEKIQQAPDNSARTQLVVQYFRKRRAVHAARQPYFFQALERIRTGVEIPSLEDICEQVFVGKRQLQRAFQDNLGVSAKTYGRIIRFAKAYEFIYKNPQLKLTEIAHEFGYADQSHFIREFREFTGEKPTTFISGYELQARMPFALRS